MMNFKQISLITLAIASLSTASVFACNDEGKHKDPQQMMQRMQERQAKLHDKLKITPAQEAAWQTFTQATKPDMPPAPIDRQAMDKLSAPEKMEKHLAMQKHHQAMMEKRLAAIKALYPQLTPEQQKIMDEHMGHMNKQHHKH